MTRYAIFLILIIMFSGRTVFSQTHKARIYDLVSETILILPGDTLIQLHNYFIQPNSDSVAVKNRILKRDEDYTLNRLQGTINLIYQPELPETLYVRYRTLPLNLKPSYQAMPFILWRNNRSDSLQNISGTANFIKSGESPAFNESRLRKNGSISRSITMGNRQGLRLDSGLRLQLEGKISDDVDVVASLSDQNTPIQPEGNTQSLQEIDKVYIKIQSPSLQATLGDFNVSYQGGRFGNYQRKLQGAQLSLQRNGFQGSISGAVSKGKFRTMTFKGEEGKQGPYQLRGDREETEIIVLAGTERVWVDGILMTRGEENDYVIEYGSGQITFTRNHLITGDSRIEVDFEYSDLRFQRNLYSARFSGSTLKNRLNFIASFIREADDQNNPLEADISEEEKSLLAQIGDKLDSAFVQSGAFVGTGKGNYILIDTLNTKIYRYVGKNAGDYQVRFSYVGDQAGDYRYIGSGRYRYEGQGKGSYSPKRNLPVAQSQNLAALYSAFNPVDAVQLSAELALSQTDQNLWSSKDDTDNLGSAFQVKAAFRPKKIQLGTRQLGELQLNGLWREQGDHFFEITRNREVEYNRRWDLSQNAVRREKVREFSGRYLPWQGVSVMSDLGKIQKGDQFHSIRRLVEIRLSRKNWPRIFYREEQINKKDIQINIKGDWIRKLGTFQYQLWRLQPTFRYEAEDKRDRTLADRLQSGFAFEDITGGLTVQVFKPLQLFVALNKRSDKTVSDQAFQDNSEARSRRFGLKLSKWKNLQLDFSYTNRYRRYQSEQPEKKTNLADLNVRYSPLKRALRTNLRLQMTTTQISKTDEFYFEVEQGRGNYRFDPEYNEYVPDPFGTFIKRILATGEFEPVNDIFINGKLNFKPGLIWQRQKTNLSPFRKLLSNLGWETYFSMNEKSRRENPWKLNFGLNGLVFPDSTVFGRYTVRQDIFLFENVRARSLRFRWMETYEKNNRLTEGGQYSLRQEQSLRYTMSVRSKFSVQTYFYQKRTDRVFKSPGRIDRLIISRGGETRLSFRPIPALELATELTFQLDKDRFQNPATEVALLSLKPNFSYAFRGRGRLRGDVEFANVSAQPGNRIIPYEMANGRRIGKNYRWQLGLDYRLSAKLMILISYIGRKDPTRDEIQHLGKAEVKAFF